jgi:ferredoxin
MRLTHARNVQGMKFQENHFSKEADENLRYQSKEALKHCPIATTNTHTHTSFVAHA